MDTGFERTQSLNFEDMILKHNGRSTNDATDQLAFPFVEESQTPEKIEKEGLCQKMYLTNSFKFSNENIAEEESGLLDDACEDQICEDFKLSEKEMEELQQRIEVSYREENNQVFKESIPKEDFYAGSEDVKPLSQNSSKSEGEGDSSDLINTNTQKGEKKRRWGKKNDVELFNIFREFENQGLISLEEITNSTSNSVADCHEGILEIIKALGCRQTPQFIWNRIKIKMNDSFSVRETKILKRELKKYSYKNIPYSSLLSLFSGKSLNGLKIACNKICSLKKFKMLEQKLSL